MSGSIPAISSNPLGHAGLDPYVNPPFITANRAPTTLDFQLAGARWEDKSQSPPVIYETSGAGIWYATAGSAGSFTTLTVTGLSTLGALTQVGTANINASGSAVTTIGTGGTGAVNIGNATGNTSVTGSLTASTGLAATTGNLELNGAASKITLNVATGASASAGVTAAMSGTPGSVTVTSSAVTTSSLIFFARKTAGGTLGNVSVSAQSAGSFTLLSSGNETSTFNWWVIN